MSGRARALLGGLSPARFLRRHWQKEPCLVRCALPDFAGLLNRASLVELAARDDVESRLVVKTGARYSLSHGPFRPSAFRSLPARGWTLLVQGVNLHSGAADALLRRFAFLPFARLDDLMVSYAVEGGGVGPHFDSYDVFLLQGAGRRRWRFGRQADLALVPGLPVKVLRRFRPEHDEVLGPGDLLYVPPQCAHEGIALGECITYSIGFRAESAQALATSFLDFLRDELDLAGRYTDPDLKATHEPARIGARMQQRTAGMLKAVRWDLDLVGRFLGRHLSEPKPQVVFDAPSPSLPRGRFARRIEKRGVALDARAQLLYDDERLYINGLDTPYPSDAAGLRKLANERALPAAACADLPPDTLDLLHEWYRDGFLAPG